jgi:hypothetical protein
MNDKHLEKIARVIAHFHGSKIVVDGATIAARRGYGSFGHSSESYANNHWKEYEQAAEAVREMIVGDCLDAMKALTGKNERS